MLLNKNDAAQTILYNKNKSEKLSVKYSLQRRFQRRLLQLKLCI